MAHSGNTFIKMASVIQNAFLFVPQEEITKENLMDLLFRRGRSNLKKNCWKHYFYILFPFTFRQFLWSFFRGTSDGHWRASFVTRVYSFARSYQVSAVASPGGIAWRSCRGTCSQKYLAIY